MYTEFVSTQVLVIGSGLAGLTAALQAAECGADVCLVSRGEICSGSSFYDGTWGLGLVGPENEADEADLEETILRIGEGMADPALVHTLVHGIAPAIRRLEERGVRLRKAENKEQKEFIPCFDHKLRHWNGLEKSHAIPVFSRLLKEAGVHCYPHRAAAQLILEKGAVRGAWTLPENPQAASPKCICFEANAVILACGGFGGIFSRCLNTADCRASGHALALQAGAEVSNMEFMQMMPGYLTPAYKTIYNEKMFGYSRFRIRGEDGVEELEGVDHAKNADILAERGTHGPFTCRLASGEVDRLLFRACLSHPEGVEVTYVLPGASGGDAVPEFVHTYFDWLEREKGLTMEDPVQIAIFAHASNGGVCIDANAFTGVPGLYACGEVTGGMHGADRLGGLSTANALVFGELAGRSAAEAVRCSVGERAGHPASLEIPVLPESGAIWSEIRQKNDRYAMILRDGESAECMLQELEGLYEKLQAAPLRSAENLKEEELQGALNTLDARNGVLVSMAVYQAIRNRPESRGSHYRVDHPVKDERLRKSFRYHLEDGVIRRQKEIAGTIRI